MVINPTVGVYIPIIRIPIEGGMTIPNIATFDHGTYTVTLFIRSYNWFLGPLSMLFFPYLFHFRNPTQQKKLEKRRLQTLRGETRWVTRA